MTFKVFKSTWLAETGLMAGGGRGYWHTTTGPATLGTEAEAAAYLVGWGKARLAPERGLVSIEMMGLVRVREELEFVRNLE